MANRHNPTAVEYFHTGSRTFVKYGFVVMPKPDLDLVLADDYFKWLQELKKCASGAGLLEHLDGTAVRPPRRGTQQEAFDKQRAAMNNFIFASMDVPTRRYYREAWLKNKKSSGEFDKIPTAQILQRIREGLEFRPLLAEFTATHLSGLHVPDAIKKLHGQWDNIRALRPEVPDGLYLCAVWSLAGTYRMRTIRKLFCESFPWMPSVGTVRTKLEEYGKRFDETPA
ncbi:hypothetical protein ACCO45_008098 [Purpureocillium lilacinum]|uniref:Uncharacterized protein n=1 Tax=Purpureocillium lilacinum TaxID=33203 RepID=A0ACC4DMC2_PURLI